MLPIASAMPPYVRSNCVRSHPSGSAIMGSVAGEDKKLPSINIGATPKDSASRSNYDLSHRSHNEICRLHRFERKMLRTVGFQIDIPGLAAALMALGGEGAPARGRLPKERTRIPGSLQVPSKQCRGHRAAANVALTNESNFQLICPRCGIAQCKLVAYAASVERSRAACEKHQRRHSSNLAKSFIPGGSRIVLVQGCHRLPAPRKSACIRQGPDHEACQF